MTALPDRIGKYPISRLLGSGGMGRVYLGTDPDLGREVAIKVLQLARNDSDGSRERFLREARAMGRLNHAHIVTLLEFGVEGNTPYLVLEFLRGEDLSGWLQRPHSLPQYLKLMHQMATAIAAAHRAGVLHRDIKPDNVRVIDDERCKLLDFGIADNFGESRVTGTGAFVGTAEFVAPEVLSGQRHAEQSDIYALGLLFYQMLAGCNPFRCEHVSATLARILQVVPPRLSTLRDGVPEPLDRLIADCLEKDPALRPSSASALVATLESCLRDLTPGSRLGPIRASASATATATATALLTSSPTTAIQRGRTPAGTATWYRHWSAAVVAVSALMLLAAVLLWWSERGNDSANPDARDRVAVAESARAPSESEQVATPRDDGSVRPPSTAPGQAVVGGTGESEPIDSNARETIEAVAADSEAQAAANEASRSRQIPAAPTAARNSGPADRQPTPAATSVNQKPAKPSPSVASRPLEVQSREPRQVETRVATADPSVTKSAAPSSAPPTAAAPAAASTAAAPIGLPVITDVSVHLLPRGRPTRMRLTGQNLSAVTAARVLLGARPDPRFKISEVSVTNDRELSLRIHVSRNIPLGRYALVVESSAGTSAPYLLEVSL